MFPFSAGIRKELGGESDVVHHRRDDGGFGRIRDPDRISDNLMVYGPGGYRFTDYAHWSSARSVDRRRDDRHRPLVCRDCGLKRPSRHGRIGRGRLLSTCRGIEQRDRKLPGSRGRSGGQLRARGRGSMCHASSNSNRPGRAKQAEVEQRNREANDIAKSIGAGEAERER